MSKTYVFTITQERYFKVAVPEALLEDQIQEALAEGCEPEPEQYAFDWVETGWCGENADYLGGPDDDVAEVSGPTRSIVHNGVEVIET